MGTRNIETAIQELVALLPAQIGQVAESACRENLIFYPQPERSMYRINDIPHSYGPNSTKICNGLHKALVFEEMCKDGRCSAPTLSHEAIYTGKIEHLLPIDDMIVKYVDQSEHAVYNITLPKHIFFPGYVKLVVTEAQGATFVDVSGKGVGNWMWPNVEGGPLLFEAILKEYLVPKVRARLDEPAAFNGHGGSSGGGGASGRW